MHTLVVSQYFRPEVGATQNRLGTFVDGLVERGHRVSVICEQPNHPAGVFARRLRPASADDRARQAR